MRGLVSEVKRLKRNGYRDQKLCGPLSGLTQCVKRFGPGSVHCFGGLHKAISFYILGNHLRWQLAYLCCTSIGGEGSFVGHVCEMDATLGLLLQGWLLKASDGGDEEI